MTHFRKALSVVAALALLAISAGSVLGHNFKPETGVAVQVDCDGFSATFQADIYGGHKYHVVAPGIDLVIVENGNDQSYRTFGPFTGSATSGTVTVTILNPNDSIENGPKSTQFSLDEDCSTPIPSPSATPIATPSPSETPVVTPSETPVVTPSESIPNTALGSEPVDGLGVLVTFAGVLLVGLSIMLIVNGLTRGRSARR